MTTIRYMERANLGNYSHREIEITDTVEDADVDKAINKLSQKVIWHLAKPEREAEYNKWVSAFARNAEMDEKQIATGKAFIAKYETALAEIEG